MIYEKVKKAVFINVLFSALILGFSACNESEEEDYREGDVTFEITDAPTDNPEVKAVFVTITDIKIDGESFPGFKGPKTVDLLSLQNGNVEALGTGKLQAKTYSSLSLELDLQNDDEGNAPGCYVLTKNLKKGISASGEKTKTITKSVTLNVNEVTNKFVIDFDLRKALLFEGNLEGTSFSFVNEQELGKAIRVINKNNSGSIKGIYNHELQIGGDSYIVAYSYKKGGFDAEAEIQSNPGFQNSINSALVGRSALTGNFKLAFLEEGEYEVHFAKYKKNNTGTFEFEGLLEIENQGDVAIDNISLNSGANIDLSVSIKGILTL